jgi:hypothetical protein
MPDFLATYFGWQPTLATLIWAILLAVVTRAFLFIRQKAWLENERLYWVVAPFAFLIILAALTYATKGTRSEPAWPPALTKTEIDNWATALAPYHNVTSVGIAFGDSSQWDFVRTLTQGISEAQWPEPGLQPFQFSVGVRIIASEDAREAATQLQHLCEGKIGTVRLQLKEASATFHPGTIEVVIGWKPK